VNRLIISSKRKTIYLILGLFISFISLESKCSQEDKIATSNKLQMPNLKLQLKSVTGPDLSLTEAMQLALENSYKIKSKRAEVDIAEAAIKTSGARPNPYSPTICNY
jgi:hypothetical protein